MHHLCITQQCYMLSMTCLCILDLGQGVGRKRGESVSVGNTVQIFSTFGAPLAPKPVPFVVCVAIRQLIAVEVKIQKFVFPFFGPL